MHPTLGEAVTQNWYGNRAAPVHLDSSENRGAWGNVSTGASPQGKDLSDKPAAIRKIGGAIEEILITCAMRSCVDFDGGERYVTNRNDGDIGWEFGRQAGPIRPSTGGSRGVRTKKIGITAERAGRRGSVQSRTTCEQ